MRLLRSKLSVLGLAVSLVARAGGAPLVPDAVAERLEASPLGGLGALLRREAPDRVTAYLWASWAWMVRDHPDKALEILEKAEAGGAGPARTSRIRARCLYETGDHAGAQAALQALPPHAWGVAAETLQGELHQTLGAYDAAREAYNRAIERFNALPDPDREERLAGARAAARNKDPRGALKMLEQLEKRHPWMVRGRFEAGELFRRHYQTGDARLEYEAGLRIRPGDPKLLGSVARVLFEDGRLEPARRKAEEALEEDPGEPRAWMVRARAAIFHEDWAGAEAAARKALERRPNDPEYLTLLAEVHAGAGAQRERAAAEARCLAVNPRYAELDEALGMVAYRQRREARALELFTRGIERRPASPGCLFRRGMLHLHAGRLGAARDDLEKARYLDPFLVSAVNYLKVLDRLEAFPGYRIPSGYLVLSPRGVSAAWPLFRDGVADLMTDLERALGHRLTRTHRVEVFSDNTWFNARVQGVPADHLRGVSFGPCLSFSSIEMERPTAGWKRTMRHELVHSFNADRVGEGYLPRWFTEGLAVHLEGKRPERWQAYLKTAAWTGGLLRLDELAEGFQRSDRIHLAYMQAGVALEWIVHEVGMDGVNRCLDLFRERVPGLEALARVMGRPLDRLEDEYRAYVAARAAAFRGEHSSRPPPPALVKEAMAGDGDARRRVAALAVAIGQHQPALQLLEGATGPDVDALRARALAGMDAPGARGALEQAAVRHPDDYPLLVALATRRLADGDREMGRAALEQAHEVHPGGQAAAVALVRLYDADGRGEDAEAVLRALLVEAPDDAWATLELAEHLEARRANREAAEQLREALTMDATRPEVALRLARLEQRLARRPEARRAYALYAGLSRAWAHRPADPAPGPEARDDDGDEAETPEGEAKWLPPVPEAARRKAVDDLEAELAAEPDPGVALAGLADALGRESLERAGRPGPAVDRALRRAMQGAWGSEAAAAAATARGLALETDAAGFLWAARDCTGQGPFGEGTCADAAREALQALAARDMKELERWWAQEGSQDAEAWFRSSLEARGYPPVPPGPDGRARLLLIVLDDQSWYRSYGARVRLERLLGVPAGRGGFRRDHHASRIFEPLRSQAVAAFKRELKQRHLARRNG